MKYKWGSGSRRRLEHLDTRLVRVLDRGLGYGLMDMTVTCTVRSKEDQDKAFREGRSEKQWPHGKHNVPYPGRLSKAVDVAPWVNGKLSYDREQCCVMAGLLLAAAREEGVKVRSGSNWDMDGEFLTDQKLDDIVHLELME